ncbi:hypothetical protein [Amycolatopsis suaedae]|uniref:WD40 repeat domain-containing protein n=1 Tax=Amycolatopsis suaedae TaxID=2510978 RepID=A0A4Q7J048_9PSEU|nr:hypothetical protein [Amycolatopsis suaedae]RZQ60159.1 hypothetical protein EWH70_31165 [Amycolatopsis suaedae]
MRRMLVGLLAVAGVLAFTPVAGAGSSWVQVGADIRSGVSGVAVVERSDRRIDALVVRDNKKPGENRIARLTWRPGRAPAVEPLAWRGELPVDLESIDPVPGRPGEYVTLASGGKGFHIKLESGAVSVLGTFTLPAGQPGDDYESFALVAQRDRTVALWADRGQDARPSTLYSAEFDVDDLTFGPARSVTFRAPSPATHVRHISDLDVTANGRLVVSSASDPGDDGPFASAVHVIGQLADGPEVTLLDKPRTMATYPGRKIEALTLLGRSGDSMLLGTDDENLGGWVRLS